MKKSIHIFLGIFLATLMVYGGSGVNAYFYCCNDCRDEGTAAFVEHKCCDIHHHHHLSGFITHYEDHLCDQSISSHDDECGVERFSVDLSFSSDNDIKLQPAIIDINFDYLVAVQDITYDADIQNSANLTPSQKPPNLSKDDYFSLLTTLII